MGSRCVRYEESVGIYGKQIYRFCVFQCSCHLGRGGCLAPSEAEEEVVLFRSLVNILEDQWLQGYWTYHGENGGEDLDLLGCGGDVVVPVVVCGEEVEHKLRNMLVYGLERSQSEKSVLP